MRFLGHRLSRFRGFLWIRLGFRFGDRINFGFSLNEIGFEEKESDDSSEKDRKKRNGNNGIHSDS